MFEEFYQKYETEEQEVIALIRKCIGAGYHKSDNSDFWEMTVITLGMVFCNTGKVSIKEGRLKWPVTEEERNSEKSWGRLQQGQICRLKVRRLLDGLVPEHTTPEQFNSWAVIDVLEPSVPCPPLEAVWEEYQKPVNIEDEVLGTLKLNRDFGLLDGKILWNEKEVSLALEIELEDEETWDTVRSIAHKVMADRESWDKSMREFAAKELTGLANEWQADDDEKKNADPIAEEGFAQRITLSELSLTYEGGAVRILVAPHQCKGLHGVFVGHIVQGAGADGNIQAVVVLHHIPDAAAVDAVGIAVSRVVEQAFGICDLGKALLRVGGDQQGGTALAGGGVHGHVADDQLVLIDAHATDAGADALLVTPKRVKSQEVIH